MSGAGVRLHKPVRATGLAGAEVVRYSSAVQRLKDRGAASADLEEFERDRKAFAVCPIHGELADPVIGIADVEGQRVAFGCPDCSGPEVRAQWEAEGRRGRA